MSLITATLLPTTKQSPTSITPPQALKNYSEADETLSIMAFVRFLQKYQLFETQSTLLKELSLGDKSQITLEEFQQAIQKKHRVSPIPAPMENEENETIKNAVIHTSQLSSEASSVQFQDVNNTSPAKIPQEITSLSSPVIKQEPHSSFLDTPTQTSNVSEIPLPLPTSTTCPTAGTVPPSFQIPICVNAFNSSQTNTSGQTVFTLLPSPQTLVSNGTHPTQFVLNTGTSVSGPQLQQLANGNLSAIIPATIQLSLPGQQPQQQQQPQILTTLPAQHALQHLPQHHIMQSPVQQLQQQFSQAQIQQPIQVQQIVQHQTQIQSPSNHIIQPQQIQIVSPKEHSQQIYNPHQQQLHKQLDHTDQTKHQQQYSPSVMQFSAKQPILTTQIQPQFVEFPIQDQKLATTSVDSANLPTDFQQTPNITTTTTSKSQDVAPASTTSNIIFSIQCLPQNSSQATTSEFIQAASLMQHPVMKSDIHLQQEGLSNLDNTPRKVIYSQIANPGVLNQTAKTIFTTNGVDPIHYTSAPAEFSNILTAGLNPHYSFDPSFELTQRRRKKRAVFAPQVRRALEQAFESNSRPSRRELEYLAQKLGLLFEEVRVWFCNKRQKERQIQMQQTFSDQPQNGSLSSIPNDADIGNESTPPLLDNNAFSQSSLLDLPEFTPDKMICTTDLLRSPIKDIVFANAVKDEFHISEQPIAMGVN